MTVYGDLYFLLNGGVDLVLLLAAGRLGRARAPVWRLSLAAAAGGGYALAQFWMPGSWAYSLAGRVLASLGMVALAFAPVGWRRFLALCLYLYAGAVFVAGVTLAVSLAAAAGWGGSLTRWAAGGGRWRAIPWWALAVALACALAAARAWRAARARHPWVVGLRVAVGQRAACCRGLVDTGNRLVDPLGSGPVVVVEARALGPLLPPELAAALDDAGAAARAADGTDWERRLRLIPFQALGSDGGLLIGFRPDRVEVEGDRPGAWTAGEPVTIGVTPRRLDPAGEYQALVPACLLGAGPERPAAADGAARAGPADRTAVTGPADRTAVTGPADRTAVTGPGEAGPGARRVLRRGVDRGA